MIVILNQLMVVKIKISRYYLKLKTHSHIPKNIQKVPRGKRAKIQKMKEKYADQDEEERELRFKLTGAREIKELREEKFSESDE